MPESPSAADRDRSRRRSARPTWPLIAALGWLAVFGAALAVAAAWLWPDRLADAPNSWLAAHYAAFMAATFVFHAGLAMLPVLVFALPVRRRRLALASLLLFIAAAGPDLITLASRRSPSTDRTGTIAIMSANLMYGRADVVRFRQVVEAHKPDVIVIQEWTAAGARAFKPILLADYPHVVESDRDDAFGQAVFSRKPFTADPKIYPPIARVGTEPQITVTIDHAGKPLRIINTHTHPPTRPTYYGHQRRLVLGLSEWRNEPDAPHVLAGDFNATTRSPIVRALLRTGCLDAHDEAGGAGRWRADTWPRIGALRHVPGIRLDHILHAQSLECTEASVCDDIGSDHAPIIARLRWRDGAR